MKKIALVFSSFLLIVFASGCSLYYTFTRDEAGIFGVGRKDAFVIGFEWDGNTENMEFIIPDEYSGVPVTKLGGYTGRGYPCPFAIGVPEEYCNDGTCSEELINDEQFIAASCPDGYEIIELQFTLHVGKNLKSLYYHKNDLYCQVTTEGEKTKFYHIDYLFECTEENGTFYSRNGVLYEKSTDKPAEWEND